MILEELLLNAIKSYNQSKDKLKLLSDINSVSKAIIKSIIEERSDFKEKNYKKDIFSTVVKVSSPEQNILPKTNISTIKESVIKSTKNIQEKNYDNLSLNDFWKRDSSLEINNQNETAKIKNLYNVIDLNARYLFIQEIFNNDEKLFINSINTINNFSSLEEAKIWIYENIIQKSNFKEDDKNICHLMSFVKKRFL